MRKMLAGAALLSLAAVLASAGVALAGRQVGGAHYSGHLRTGNPSPPLITFDVSPNRAEVRNLKITYPPLLCALGGMTPPQRKASPAPISRSGIFVKTVEFAATPGSVFATIRVSGRFRAHRRASGRARVRWIGGFEPGCGGTVRFSARGR